MNKIIKKKRIYKKWTISCIFILLICVISGSIFYYYNSAPQRIIKQYLNNRFNYSYNSIEKKINKRMKILSANYIKETEDNGVINNFLIEVKQNHISSQLGDYSIKSITTTDHSHDFLVTVTSYIKDDSKNITKNEMVGIFTVKRYSLWKCLIFDIVPIQNEEINHENHNHTPNIVE